jgi:hypothetical protein
VKTPANPRKKVKAGQGLSCQSLDKMTGDISNPALRTVLMALGQYLDPELPENKEGKGENHA